MVDLKGCEREGSEGGSREEMNGHPFPNPFSRETSASLPRIRSEFGLRDLSRALEGELCVSVRAEGWTGSPWSGRKLFSKLGALLKADASGRQTAINQTKLGIKTNMRSNRKREES